jgi:uncharacterized protein YoxC
MASVEVLWAIINEKATEVGDYLLAVDEKVQGVGGKVKDVGEKVQDVEGEVRVVSVNIINAVDNKEQKNCWRCASVVRKSAAPLLTFALKTAWKQGQQTRKRNLSLNKRRTNVFLWLSLTRS